MTDTKKNSRSDGKSQWDLYSKNGPRLRPPLPGLSGERRQNFRNRMASAPIPHEAIAVIATRLEGIATPERNAERLGQLVAIYARSYADSFDKEFDDHFAEIEKQERMGLDIQSNELDLSEQTTGLIYAENPKKGRLEIKTVEAPLDPPSLTGIGDTPLEATESPEDGSQSAKNVNRDPQKPDPDKKRGFLGQFIDRILGVS